MTGAPQQPSGSRPLPAARAWYIAQAILIAVAGALLAWSLVRLGAYFWFALTCPYEIEYGEGVLLHNAISIARGGEVYNDFHHYPYLAATYPPMFPLVSAIGVKLFGVSFAFGRAVSVLSTLGTAVLIWLILRRTGRGQFASGLAAVLFLAAPIVCWWGPVMRVDMLAVMLGVAAVYCVMRGGRWLGVAVVLMVAAIFTRQSEVAPLAAGVGYLWWVRQRRQAVFVGAAWMAAVLLISGALQAASHGWFFRHVVTANENAWHLQTFFEWWTEWVIPSLPFPFVLGLGGAVIALGGWGGSVGDSRARAPQGLRLLALYFVFAMLVSLTAGKIGAAVNYFLEPLAAACLMTGVAVQWLGGRLHSWPGKAAWVAAWLVLVSAPAYALVRPEVDQYWPYRLSREKIIAGGNEALALVRAAKGDILSEDSGLPLLAGRRLLLDPHKMTSLFRDGVWNQRPLIEDIERRRFALIITRWDPVGGATDRWGTVGDYRWSIGMGRAIMQNYYLVKKTGFLYITAPLDGKHRSCDQLHQELVRRAQVAR